MKTMLRRLLFIFLCLPVLALAEGTAPSHCAKTEKMIFNCQIQKSQKILSVCASPSFATEAPYVQYRFGKPGKVELEYPAEKNNSVQQFSFSHYVRFQVSYTALKFKIGAHEYSVFDDYNGEEDPDKPSVLQGVNVDEATLECAAPVTSKLFELEHVVPCDKDQNASCEPQT